MTRDFPRPHARLGILFTALTALPARADQGALSLDLGAGVASLVLPAPYASSRRGPGFAPTFLFTAGLRYALTHHFELSVTGYYELPVTVAHTDVVLVTATSGSFTGNLRYEVSQWGVLAGVRYVTGLVARFFVGLEAGMSHRAYSSVQLLDPTRPGTPDYRLGLQDFATDSLVLQPLVGLEWAFADHWSASLTARFTVLVGPEPAAGASLVLSVAYSWFL